MSCCLHIPHKPIHPTHTDPLPSLETKTLTKFVIKFASYISQEIDNVDEKFGSSDEEEDEDEEIIVSSDQIPVAPSPMNAVPQHTVLEQADTDADLVDLEVFSPIMKLPMKLFEAKKRFSNIAQMKKTTCSAAPSPAPPAVSSLPMKLRSVRCLRMKKMISPMEVSPRVSGL